MSILVMGLPLETWLPLIRKTPWLSSHQVNHAHGWNACLRRTYRPRLCMYSWTDNMGNEEIDRLLIWKHLDVVVVTGSTWRAIGKGMKSWVKCKAEEFWITWTVIQRFSQNLPLSKIDILCMCSTWKILLLAFLKFARSLMTSVLTFQKAYAYT